MVAIMRDGMGVGLAATQLGVLRRLLVFQAGADGEPTALVNPQIEWLSDEASIAEEGCLSLPRDRGGRRAPAARPGQRPRRPTGEPIADRGLGPRGAGAPARDRPPRRRPDPRPHRARAAQGRPAGAARGRQLQPAGRATSPTPTTRRRPTREDRLPRHLDVRRDGAARLADVARTGRRSSSPRPTAARAAAGGSPPPPAAAAARGARDRAAAGRERQRRRTRAGADPRRREPELGVVCAFGQLIREPLLIRARDAQRASRRCCRAGAVRRRSSARSWPATPDRASRDAASPPASTRARSRLGEARADRPDDDYGRSPTRLGGSAAGCSSRALDLRAPGRARVRRAGRRGGTYAEKIDPAERRLDPARPAIELERTRAGPHPAHRRLPGDSTDGERLGVRRRDRGAGRAGGGRLDGAEGALLPRLRAMGCCGCTPCSPPAGGRWRPTLSCAATPCPSSR